MSNLGKKLKKPEAAKKSLPQTFQRPKSGKHTAFIFKEQQLI